MNLKVIRQSIAGPVAMVAVALTPLAGVTTTMLAVTGAPGHAAAQLTPPTRFTPPDPCRSAC
jgi:hypothetical protein